MAHIRTSIRSAVVTALTGLTTTGARVFPSRVRPLQDSELPCLLVFLDDEEIAVGSVQQHPLLERRATLRVRALAKATATMDATLDTMLGEVETALGNLADPSLGGLITSQIIPAGIEVDIDDSLEKPVGMMTISMPVQYFTFAGAPGASA